MAVTRSGVGYTRDYVLGPDADGSRQFSINVASQPNTYGIVAYGIVGDSDIDGATLGVTWDGDAATPLCDPLYFDTSNSVLTGWIVENPTSGTVVASYADLPFGLITKNLFVAAATFSSVTPLDLDTIESAVVTAVASGSVGSSGVTVPSGVPADRVISGHLIGKFRAFANFSGTKLAAPLLAGGGQLLLGESRGAPSTVVTANHIQSSANWAAFGLNLDALPIETLGFATSTVTVPPASFGADLYRWATPHPDRFYPVPGLGSGDPNLIAGEQIRSANGVWMPVWQKDPDDTLEYTLRWDAHLAPDDEIVKVEHRSEIPALRIISEGINPDDPAETQFWTKSGIRGITHPVRIRLWTKFGRQHDFTAFIAGENN